MRSLDLVRHVGVALLPSKVNLIVSALRFDPLWLTGISWSFRLFPLTSCKCPWLNEPLSTIGVAHILTF